MRQTGPVTDTARSTGGSGRGAATDYQLSDRYHREDGRIFLSGVQAIARIPVDQLRIDRRNGLATAAFVSGYQGSPVGAFGEEVDRARRTQPDLPIVNQPGVNEELAATAVMGSQLAVTLDDCKYDGVLGIWYGKAPGVDRASDAIRHGVFAGTAAAGGVVAVVGDDPSAKSSTLPSSSDATMVDLHMPVLFPGDTQEALELARHAVAVSRACGLWAGLKVVTPVADGTGTVDVRADLVTPILPTIEIDGRPYRPHPDGRLITPYSLEREREFYEIRTELARQYGALNDLNRVTVRSGDDWIGIAACGHTYHELREALQALGFATDDDLRSAGIRLFQLTMPVPLDRHDVREFAAGLTDVLVIEEKNPTLEVLVRDALYDLAERPRVWGKRDEEGHVLVPYDSLLDASRMLPALRHHLGKRLADRLTPERPTPKRELIPLSVNRAPYFCSGCPHNTSTRVEPGTLVGAGIGCHGMVALMDPERIGDVVGLTCMGNEGTQWIGIAPFVERDHLVQNLGDGTFFHSGSVAVRAAIASGVDITYKLLYNGTVAMTGGQDPQGRSTSRRSPRSSTPKARRRSSSRATTPTGSTATTFPMASRCGIGAASTRRNACSRVSRAPRSSSTTRRALRRSVAPAAAGGCQAPGSGWSSTNGSARAAATAVTSRTASRSSRSTPRTAARPRSTRRAATSTSRACRATVPRSRRSRSTATLPLPDRHRRHPTRRRCPHRHRSSTPMTSRSA
jgi:indolepyruvate ferredoxin oxidoreductase